MASFKLPSRPTPAQQRRELSNNEGLNDDEVDLVLNQLAEAEQSSLLGAGLGKQTWSRYLVDNYFSKYKWYNPNRDSPDISLAKGWAYFEHFTLPRRFVTKSGGHHMRAPPGETNETKLYSAFLTPQSSLSDWGIGMGMYFSTLSSIGVILLLAGILSIPNIIWYSSDRYDPSPNRDVNFSLMRILRFSAICSSREWVKCDDCNADTWNNIFTNNYYGTGIDVTTGETVTLINRTTCLPAQFAPGMWSFGVLLLLILCITAYNIYLSKLEVRWDEDNTSAPDYSLVVMNPPKDAKDPEEWKLFFDTFSDKQVTLVTVALGNDELLKSIVAKRRNIKILRGMLPEGINYSDEEALDEIVRNEHNRRLAKEKERSCLAKLVGMTITPLLRGLGFCLTEDVIWKRIKATNTKIKELEQRDYDASAVFVTFETEQGQRTALEALNFSQLEVLTNTAINADPSSIFRDTVLSCYEAADPDSIRYNDLKCTNAEIWLRQVCTFVVTCALVALSGYVLFLTRIGVSTTLFSVILAATNSLIPMIVRILVTYEKHRREGALQASLYLKITLFRWMNAVIVTWLITPFLVTIGENSLDLISTINATMLSEMIVAPLLRYFDVLSFLERHILAPRAKTEEQMLACFRGGWYSLSERFTDLTKVLLLCIFYSPFYPFIYFLGAATLFFQYWMDKFLLLRGWQRAPTVGADTPRFSRRYFSTAAIVIGAIGAGYAYARSPYTFLCSCSSNRECSNLTSSTNFTNVTLLNGDDIGDVGTASEGYYFCDQKYIGFPPIPSKQMYSQQWMTLDQENLTKIFGIFCVVVVAIYGVYALLRSTVKLILSLVTGVYEPTGVDQRKDFSSGVGIESFGYIPSLEVAGFHFPFLACNIDDIDVRLIKWKDPNHKKENAHRQYDEHNLIYDVSPERRNAVFSRVKHFPPSWCSNSK